MLESYMSLLGQALRIVFSCSWGNEYSYNLGMAQALVEGGQEVDDDGVAVVVEAD